MRVEIVPCLSDNYAYVVVCETARVFAVVDASEAAPVFRAAAPLLAEGFKPVAVLSTHHHHDHVGGNVEVRSAWNAEVYGGEKDQERIPALTKPLADGDRFRIGDIEAHVRHVPGHTLGAIAYVCEAANRPPCVFTGDTMFVAGAGRLFEGTPEMMVTSLSVLAALDPATRVYCGHEYTETNLKFASTLEPGNADVAERLSWAKDARAKGKPTVPSTIGDECRTNPFVRVRSVELRASLGLGAGKTDAEVLAAVRATKDAFRA